MKKNNLINSNEAEIFLYHMKGVKKIIQDKIYHINSNNKNYRSYYKNILEQEAHSYYFKDFVDRNSFFFTNNPICFVRNMRYNIDLKKLKKGEYVPEIVLDLHGMNLYQAKKELGNDMICHKENFLCASILHGYGKGILQKHIPFWLSKHPDIVAFHQAPKIFGNDAAILIFLKNNYSD
ncbi:endonuclease SmrB [Buchnera aphidicola]|uniref:Putative phage-like protein n=1 Tax=Buchnera aphidicola subsp. Cinara cedri (strain Cc) TaxID=372461 RepID=Q058A9_BUCCC|nr:endonuclease SmrB [Buchnera aphidicola]ABJ90540.1 putative phage-like protein [Buchnera aphidicola BCc]